MKIIENYIQKSMINKIKTSIPNVHIKKGNYGSFAIKSQLVSDMDWHCVGKTDFDKFIKRYQIQAKDDNEKIFNWTLATRGDEEKSCNVTMIIPIFKDKLGNLWTLLQEESRPIDLFRNGKESRLFAFPAGVIGDEIKSESALESAVRELTEETGFVADSLQVLNSKKAIPTSPGLTDESTNYFLANIKNLELTKNALTDSITRAWWFIPLRNLTKWLLEMENKGKIATGQTLSALALLSQKTKLKF
ncbi:NUDIX hydrolase [bacterium]|nr:NUDIX hydrolase [bacterium]